MIQLMIHTVVFRQLYDVNRYNISKPCRVDYSIGSTQKPEFNVHEKMNNFIFKKYLISSEAVLH